MKNNLKRTLVLGSNGKTGSRVLKKLVDLNLPVREGSRNAELRFDWEDSSTWKSALTEIQNVYLSFQPDLAMPGAAQTIEHFCSLAKACGVERLILLSGRGEKEAEDCEEIVKASGMKWTIVRASWFHQNFSENYFLEPVLAGIVALPIGAVKEPFIDADDIADVVVTVLITEGHDGKLYEITGPRLLSFKDAVAEIALATGREIKYLQVSMEDYIKEMEVAKIPHEYIKLIEYLFSAVLDGRNESITNGVEYVLNRKPKDFSIYAKETAALGVWNVDASVL